MSIWEIFQRSMDDKGYFSPLLIKLNHKLNTKIDWEYFIQARPYKQGNHKWKKLMKIFDFVLEIANKIIIGTASEVQLSSGEIEFEQATILKFESKHIKEKHLVGLCQSETSLRSMRNQLRKLRTSKTRKYRNKIRNTLIQEKQEIVIKSDDDEEEVHQPDKREALNREHFENCKRKLMLCSESSESEQLLIKDKLFTQIALFSLKNPSSQQNIKVCQEEEKPHKKLTLGTFAEVGGQVPKKKSKQSKHSLGQEEKQKIAHHQRKQAPLPKSKKEQKREEMDQKKEEMSKQSKFMSNWFKKDN